METREHEDKWSGFDRWCGEEKQYVFDPATHEETAFIPPRSLEIAEKLTKQKQKPLDQYV